MHFCLTPQGERLNSKNYSFSKSSDPVEEVAVIYQYVIFVDTFVFPRGIHNTPPDRHTCRLLKS